MARELAGRYLVLLSDRSPRLAVAALRRAAGPRVATTLDVRSGALPPEQTQDADAVYFNRLGVAVVNGASTANPWLWAVTSTLPSRKRTVPVSLPAAARAPMARCS